MIGTESWEKPAIACTEVVISCSVSNDTPSYASLLNVSSI